jgi:protein-tyrosine phosphatase
MNFLFVCSRNKWRSRTAETIFKNNGQHIIKSAGTASSARIKVNRSLLEWADTIFVMERKHQKQIIALAGDLDGLSNKINILHIPDEYQYMDEELIEILQASIDGYF